MNEYVRILENKLVTMAQERGWKVEQAPKALTATSFRSSTMFDLPEPGNLPASKFEFRSIAIDFCSVLIGDLGSEISDWENALRSAHHQAAVARSWLRGGSDVDLYLLLVGPAISNKNNFWQDCARAIERDERICRKLVWIPNTSSALETDLDTFCERTFLAEPWSAFTRENQHDLDPLSTLEADLALEFTQATKFSRTVLRRWLQILDRPEEAGPKVAQELLAALRND